MVLREIALRNLLHFDLELGNQDFQVLGGQFEIKVHLFLFLGLMNDVLELVLFDAHHHVAEHLDETAVRVPGEALVPGHPDESVYGLIVQPEVQDRVHHAGHGELGS